MSFVLEYQHITVLDVFVYSYGADGWTVCTSREMYTCVDNLNINKSFYITSIARYGVYSCINILEKLLEAVEMFIDNPSCKNIDR